MRQSLVALLILLLSACTQVPTQTPSRPQGILYVPPLTLTLIDYGRFSLLYDCERGEAHRFQYRLDADHGTLKRPNAFTLDKAFPAGCAQQLTSQRYNKVHAGFDVGHLAPINQFDDDLPTMLETNHMPNLVPQLSQHNRRTWYATELIAECYRDIRPLEVIGGVVYGDSDADRANDYFVESHGIRTPEFFWRVILTTDPLDEHPKIIAWYIPHREGLGTDIDPYLVSVHQLERLLGPDEPSIEVPELLKDDKAAFSWPLPQSCNRS
ncbi:DNA/RNA non-specific endonuclease [Pseudomonas sp. RIT-PI-AD]|uniref:DNA/RNA non-specific endonuclease n=1 Tax=Pseudomonas sp. RIT-PI-AD TaxID=3035294 RepID=UPI0021D9C905|nr:DNA/RNA non-specific endonuclease [Pseudomonas sp. RIT-PI-AD]